MESDIYQFMLGVTVHCCLQNKAPEYLADYCIPVSDIPSWRHLWSAIWPYHVNGSALSVVGPSLLQVRRSGTCYQIRQSPWPGAQQQQLQTITEDEPISTLLLSTHSVVEMPHDSVLYKSIIDIDTDWELQFLPVHLMFSLGGSPLEHCHNIWCGKPRMVWLSNSEKNLKICLFLSTESTNVTDGQTDTAWQHRLRSCIALRGNSHH